MKKDQMIAQLEFAQMKDTNLSLKKQRQLIVFLLVFNVFEARLFKDGRCVSRLLQKISNDLGNEQWIRVSDFQEYVDFFKGRYVENDQVTHAFESLKLSGNVDLVSTDRGNAKAVLLGKETSPENVLRCCFCIAYRFRNNLFHGNKNVLGLNEYYDCFGVIVDFIVSILHQMINNDFKGLQTKY